jgi:dihydroorotate dehydrogenase
MTTNAKLVPQSGIVLRDVYRQVAKEIPLAGIGG